MNLLGFLCVLQSLESPNPREVPFFEDSSATAKTETTSSVTERHDSISGTSHLDEKLSVLSDQKPSPPEKCPASESSKLDEKAKQHVVLNPGTQQQQVPQVQDGGQVSAEHLGSESTSLQQNSHTVQPAPMESTGQDEGINGENKTVDFIPEPEMSSPVRPRKRFTVKKVEDPVSHNFSSSEVKLENSSLEPVSSGNSDSNPGSTSANEVASEDSNNVIQYIHTEPETKMDMVAEGYIPDKESAEPGVEQARSDNIQKSSADLMSAAVSSVESSQADMDIESAKDDIEQQHVRPSRTIQSQIPSNVFVPVDNSNSEEQILPRDTKFEAGLSSEELHCETSKTESVVSLDDDLTTSGVAAKLPGAPLSASEFSHGRFIVSVSSSRPETPSSDTSEQAKPSLQAVEITLQDVANKVGTESVPSLTPSSSMESLNSVGSQQGGHIMHPVSGSPQTILTEAQNAASQMGNKEAPARKNSGQSDILSDTVKLVKLDGDQGKQTCDQVSSFCFYPVYPLG